MNSKCVNCGNSDTQHNIAVPEKLRGPATVRSQPVPPSTIKRYWLNLPVCSRRCGDEFIEKHTELTRYLPLSEDYD